MQSQPLQTCGWTLEVCLQSWIMLWKNIKAWQLKYLRWGLTSDWLQVLPVVCSLCIIFSLIYCTCLLLVSCVSEADKRWNVLFAVVMFSIWIAPLKNFQANSNETGISGLYPVILVFDHPLVCHHSPPLSPFQTSYCPGILSKCCFLCWLPLASLFSLPFLASDHSHSCCHVCLITVLGVFL